MPALIGDAGEGWSWFEPGIRSWLNRTRPLQGEYSPRILDCPVFGSNVAGNWGTVLRVSRESEYRFGTVGDRAFVSWLHRMKLQACDSMVNSWTLLASVTLIPSPKTGCDFIDCINAFLSMCAGVRESCEPWQLQYIYLPILFIESIEDETTILKKKFIKN